MGILGLFRGKKKAPAEIPPVPTKEEQKRAEIHAQLEEEFKAKKELEKRQTKIKVVGLDYREKTVKELLGKDEAYKWSKRELLDFLGEGDRIYQYATLETKDVELVPEPDNPEDPEAIKAIVYGEFIGYVRATQCKKVKKLMSNRDKESYTMSATVYGGPYKSVKYNSDEDKYELVEGERSFVCDLIITKEK